MKQFMLLHKGIKLGEFILAPEVGPFSWQMEYNLATSSKGIQKMTLAPKGCSFVFTHKPGPRDDYSTWIGGDQDHLLYDMSTRSVWMESFLPTIEASWMTPINELPKQKFGYYTYSITGGSLNFDCPTQSDPPLSLPIGALVHLGQNTLAGSSDAFLVNKVECWCSDKLKESAMSPEDAFEGYVRGGSESLRFRTPVSAHKPSTYCSSLAHEVINKTSVYVAGEPIEGSELKIQTLDEQLKGTFKLGPEKIDSTPSDILFDRPLTVWKK